MTWKPDYCTSAELKAYVRIPDDDTQDDTEVALAVTAASRAIDRATLRQFGQVNSAVDRFYRAEGHRHHRYPAFTIALPWPHRGHRTVDIDDLQDDTGLTITVDGTAVTDYLLLDRNAPADGMPWTQLRLAEHLCEHEITVHGLFGWTAVPTTIKQATLLQASRLIARRDSPFGVAGSPDIGSEFRLLPKLDPDVALTVRPYYRWWGAR